MLAVLASEGDVRALSPDLRGVATLPVGGLIVTAERRDGGVLSRCLAPAYGIPEDTVNGSAHCTVGPYWRDQLGAALSADQASPRGKHLTVVTTDGGRVLLGGRARTAVTARGPAPDVTGGRTGACTRQDASASSRHPAMHQATVGDAGSQRSAGAR